MYTPRKFALHSVVEPNSSLHFSLVCSCKRCDVNLLIEFLATNMNLWCKAQKAKDPFLLNSMQMKIKVARESRISRQVT